MAVYDQEADLWILKKHPLCFHFTFKRLYNMSKLGEKRRKCYVWKIYSERQENVF